MVDEWGERMLMYIKEKVMVGWSDIMDTFEKKGFEGKTCSHQTWINALKRLQKDEKVKKVLHPKTDRPVYCLTGEGENSAIKSILKAEVDRFQLSDGVIPKEKIIKSLLRFSGFTDDEESYFLKLHLESFFSSFNIRTSSIGEINLHENDLVSLFIPLYRLALRNVYDDKFRLIKGNNENPVHIILTFDHSHAVHFSNDVYLDWIRRYKLDEIPEELQPLFTNNRFTDSQIDQAADGDLNWLDRIGGMAVSSEIEKYLGLQIKRRLELITDDKFEELCDVYKETFKMEAVFEKPYLMKIMKRGLTRAILNVYDVYPFLSDKYEMNELYEKYVKCNTLLLKVFFEQTENVKFSNFVKRIEAEVHTIFSI